MNRRGRGPKAVGLALALFLLMIGGVAYAAPSAPTDFFLHQETLGEIYMSWSHPDPSSVAYYQVEVMRYDQDWFVHGTTTNMQYVISPAESGVTYHVRVRAVGHDGSVSEPSTVRKQTPPVHVDYTTRQLDLMTISGNKVRIEHRMFPGPFKLYMNGEVVWEDMYMHVFEFEIPNPEPGQEYVFQIENGVGDRTRQASVIYRENLSDMSPDDFFDRLNDLMERLFTPSDDAMNRLIDAIDRLKGSIGVGDAIDSGNDLQDSIGGSDLSPPVQIGPPAGDVPPTQGTDTEWTIKIPITHDLSGNVLEIELFTKEQFQRLTWWSIIRDVLSAAMWIMFVVWLVNRFTPQFKV